MNADGFDAVLIECVQEVYSRTNSLFPHPVKSQVKVQSLRVILYPFQG
jgi:hypothetical protein